MSDRLTLAAEIDADSALYHMARLRDHLVARNERVAAEHIEAAIQHIMDACRDLTRKAAA